MLLPSRLKRRRRPTAAFPLAPMIDAVFLLLIYFIVSASLEPEEADIAFELPGTVEQLAPLAMPEEEIIELRDDGQIVVNSYPYDTPQSHRCVELGRMLYRYRRACEANQAEAAVVIAPGEATLHEHIVKVLDACAAAGVQRVSFAVESLAE